MEQSDIPVFYRDVALLHLPFAILSFHLFIFSPAPTFPSSPTKFLLNKRERPIKNGDYLPHTKQAMKL